MPLLGRGRRGAGRRAALAAVVAQAAPPPSHGGVPLLPRAHITPERTGFYVYGDDVVLFPISFSIPKHRILRELPEKTAFVVNDSWKSFQIKHYRFGPLEEEAYFRDLQKHRFGDTRRKGGHDCLRHYEMLASGCIPIFENYENMPRSILTTLPSELLLRAKALYALPWTNTETGPGECPSEPAAYESLGTELLRYTAQHLSTESSARRLLETLGSSPQEEPKVLFLTCKAFDLFPSYLTASVFHGLVSLLGDNVVDVPEYEYAYELTGLDPEQEAEFRGRIWGQGFTLGFQLPKRPHLNRENITRRIWEREFDFIVFARMSPYEPCNFASSFAGMGSTVPEHFPDVFGTYPRERVALLYGDDSGLDDAVIRSQLRRMGGLRRGIGLTFMRELLPFPSEGPPSEVLRPVDDAILQPGCFYPEWLDFFRRWYAPGGGLRGCAIWGRCQTPEVEEYFEEVAHDFSLPPEDGAVLRQFCRVGMLLQAALLVQRLGPVGCARSWQCSYSCSYGVSMYSRHLMDVPAEAFHAELGTTPHEVVFVLSLGCQGGQMALQPAVAERRRSVALVAEGGGLLAAAGGGALSGASQVQYLLQQGFSVLLAGNATAPLPEALQPFADAGALELTAWRPDTLCGLLAAGPPLLYLHVELPAVSRPAAPRSAALGCLLSQRAPQRPDYASLQLPACGPAAAGPGAGAAEAGPAALALLQAAGYQRFKASRLAGGGLGGPFGPRAVDHAAGTRWRSAADLLREGLACGGQVHAAT